jgi:hypothetical protein
MTNDEILKMYEEGYPPELPRKANFFDLLKPDPLRPQIQAYDRRIAQSSAPVMPQDSGTQVNSAPPANRGSFNLSGLTDYIPSASTIGSYIPTSLPNVFGVNNPLYAGLLGDPQSQALSKQSNIAGLLGAAAALVQGMGRQGGRRSAAQNIISALGAGYGSAGQQYQQGLQMYGQTQQLALQQRQQAAIQAMKLKYPEYADEIDANPSGAFRLIAEREAAGKKLITAKPGEVIFDPTGKQIAQVPAETKPEKQEVFTGDYGNLALAMFQTAKASELSDPQREALSKKAEQLGIGKGQSITSNIYTGELSKGTKGELEKTILSTGDAITRLNSIQASNRPEYQTPKFKGIQELSTFKDKYLTLSQEEKNTLTNFSKYRQNTTQNLNQTIKDMTGSAMGVQEADRIISTLPNAGTGIFDGDSPTQFQAKLNNAIEQTKYALARKNYALSKGLKWENIKLDDVPNIVNQRGKEIEKQYKLDPKDPATKKTVDRQLAAEFGISF